MSRKGAAVLAVAAVPVMAASVAFTDGAAPKPATASSHREAPSISDDPTVDNTDLYAFRSNDAPDKLTVIANWIPAEDPAAGPNYWRFAAGPRYNIHIDRNHDAVADVTYRFQFTNRPHGLLGRKTQQLYTVTRVTRNGETVLGRRFFTPPANTGPRTTPNYPSLALRRVATRGGVKIFAGQRDDAFFADVGAIFDNLAFRRGTGATGGGKDFLGGYAVHTASLQIPISQIKGKGNVVGVWSTTERTGFKIVRGKIVPDMKRFNQVSRLANPLFNELIVPVKLRDEYNSRKPAGDAKFRPFTVTPVLAAVMNQLYPVVNAPTRNRDDLVQVFLTGVPGLNFTGRKVFADMMRINLSIPPTAPEKVSRLGVLGGDLAGYPNGRRLTDDVVDISERAVAGALKGNKIELGDGVDQNDQPFLNVFPYQAHPTSGFDNVNGDQQP